MPSKKTICYSGIYNNKNEHHTEKEAKSITKRLCKNGPQCPNTNDIAAVIEYLGANYISKTLCDKQAKHNKMIRICTSKIDAKYKKYLDKVQLELQEHSKITGIPVEKYAPDVVAKIIAAKCGKLANEIYILELQFKKLTSKDLFSRKK